MSYSVLLSSHFKQQVKQLRKKYPSIDKDLLHLVETLEGNPTIGTAIGSDIYKIRIAVSSKNKGKSGGARVLSYVRIIETTVLLFSIYSKGEQGSLSDKEINEQLLKALNEKSM